MSELAEKTCIPCKGGVAPLSAAQWTPLLEQLDSEWLVVESHHLERTFRFKDFAQALAFVNRVGEVAEQQQHHPDLHLAWGKVGVEIWTHKIDGLHESDFILAAKCDRIFQAS